jgi:hypothetical protein
MIRIPFNKQHKATRRIAARTGRLPVVPALVLALVLASPAHGETGKAAADTEAVRSEAVELINRLHRLERELLYPAHTRVSVFLSIAANSRALPHSVSVEIDGSKVTDHVYTQKEIDALHAGGIQRLYTGNTLTGKHKLGVSLRQTAKDGSVRTHALEYRFNKDVNAENIEITVNDSKPYIVIQSRS